MVSVVVGGVIEKDGKFLLVQEAQERCRGKWNLPAGHLDPNETIFDGAKREIKEETGCSVELTGILQIGNRVSENDVFIDVIFSTKLIDENIEYNPSEILDVKWFTYEEILNMKEELRTYNLLMGSITSQKDNKIGDINLVQML